MIRVHTFLKYSKLQLQEAETALLEDRYDVCFRKVADMGDSLLKTLSAALPMVKRNFLAMDEKAVARYAADLADDPADAADAASLIAYMRRFRHEAPDGNAADARTEAENACSAAGMAFSIIHGLFN